MDLAWWIAVIGVPLVGGIFICIGTVARRIERVKEGAALGDQRLHERLDKLVEAFGAYQTDAAGRFATREEINGRLQRIEEKIDRLFEKR